MHLTVAAHDFYPDPGSGGTGRYVYETARRFVRRGHRVSVITRRRGDVPRRETLDGIAVYRYDIAIADRSAVDIAPQLPGALDAVRGHVETLSAVEPPDVLSFQGPVTSLLVDRVADAAIPRIATVHSPWPTEYAIKTRGATGAAALRRRLNVGTRRWLERRVLARTDCAITLSEFMRGEFRRAYDRPAATAVIPGGVDADRFTPDADPYEPMAAGDPAFLTVRRLAARMGHDLLFSAFAAVADRHPDARLYVAGDGPLRGRLERTAERLGVADRITFLGYVPDADLPAAYAAADVFVLPTRELEGFGLATLEALAAGTPVVATPVGGTVEVLDGLVDDPAVPVAPLASSVDARALARPMRSWASLSAAERTVAGRACRRFVRERYPWERTVAALESHYGDWTTR